MRLATSRSSLAFLAARALCSESVVVWRSAAICRRCRMTAATDCGVTRSLRIVATSCSSITLRFTRVRLVQAACPPFTCEKDSR